MLARRYFASLLGFEHLKEWELAEIKFSVAMLPRPVVP